MTRVVFIEFPDEVDAYLRCERKRPNQDIVISLNPGVRSQLQRCSIDSHSTLPYFTAESHERGLRRSTEICEWLRNVCASADERDMSPSYTNAVVWYVRLMVQECLWAIEIISNALSRHKPDCVLAGCPSLDDLRGQYLSPSQRFLGILAQRCLQDVTVLFLNRDRLGWADLFARIYRQAESLVTNAAISVLTPFHYRSVVAWSHEQPVLFTTDGYNMEAVAREMIPAMGGATPLLIRERPRPHSLLPMFRKTRKSAFQHETWLEMWTVLATQDRRTCTVLTSWLNVIAERIENARKVFSHQDVSFADIVTAKFRGGIGPFILQLHRRTAGLQLLLDTVKPRAVISAGDREDDMLIGEACLNRSVPALMVSHGSHVPPKDDLETSEWEEQARRMICAPYPYVALQSPLAEEFVKVIPTSATPVRTGPVVWGRPAQRCGAKNLQKTLIPQADRRRVVVHAGTPKWRGSVRFHVYETPDEYLQSLSDLAHAVESLRSVHLVIKFRPCPVLSAEDLRSALPASERISLCVNQPFGEVLGMADLLVSFSSTTIEEALQNHIPVLLYGGHGRYRHISSVEIDPNQSCPLAPIYAVRRADHLGQAIEGIFKVHGGAACTDQLFERYRFQATETISLAGWLANGIGTGKRGTGHEIAEEVSGVSRC